MQSFGSLLAAVIMLSGLSAVAVAQTSGPAPDQDSGAAATDFDARDNDMGSAGGNSGNSSGPDDLPLEFTRPENERQVRALLESQGYADIRNIQMDGEVITADATRDGAPQHVVIRLKSESQDGG